MLVPDGSVPLGEWLPDLPPLNHPGLVEAHNCIPVEGSYTVFSSLTTSGDALTSTPLGAFAAVDSAGDPEIYAGTAETLEELSGSSWTDRSDETYNATYWQFAQFDNYVFATNFNDELKYRTIGSTDDFATVTDAPNARQVGVINRFLMAGDLDQGSGAVPHLVQWSEIDDPLSWPTPNTAAALTAQAGEQYLQAEKGAVTAIAGGQFWGLVFQKLAITRFTYVGGQVVFQVDNFEKSRGCWAPRSHIQVGNLSYFLAADGFYLTDGQSVVPIGDGKIDRWFLSRLNQGQLDAITCGVDWANKCIYWSFPTIGDTPDTIAIHSLKTGRWTYASESVDLVFQSFTAGVTLEDLDTLFPDGLESMTISLDSPQWRGGLPTIQGFASSKIGSFNGSPPVTTFETGETDVNPFGRVFIRGVRPLLTGNPTAVTVALALRDSQDNESRTFGSAVSRTTRTGVCDFREQGRFVSARLQITGGFDRAIALQFDSEPGDQV